MVDDLVSVRYLVYDVDAAPTLRTTYLGFTESTTSVRMLPAYGNTE